ncbi:MAG: helix-turn-helix domain-containing protein [Bacillota bacterium]|nr:helix-turn-helix domain-containing protein [Bacillota bacterium]
MDQYITGKTIKALRENNGMTQAEVAEKLNVSDKTISKWETSKGYPDISLLEPISELFGITITELLSGDIVKNINVSANMMRSKFYICPVCGNILHCMGEAVIHCHGVQLIPCQPEATDENHKMSIEKVEDEYYVHIEHEMKKDHYISFVAAVSDDRIQMVKLYPEGNAETRFQMRGVRKILFYCNRDGLYSMNIKK